MTREVASARAYLRLFVVTALMTICSTSALVIVIDPYGLYHVLDRQGINAVKPRLSRYQTEIKLTQAVALNSQVLILGNSRAEVGFDPAGPTLRGISPLAYNLAIPGTGIDTAHGQLDYLLRSGHAPKLIVLGIEFIDFVVAPDGRSGATGKISARSGHAIERTFWRFDSVFSLLSVKDAVRTVLIQRNEEAETHTPRGFNPLKEYYAIARNDGYNALFKQRAQENTRMFLKKESGSLGAADFDHLQGILQLAAKHGIEVKMVIYPYHAQMLALFEATGLWPMFETWKAGLTREIVSVRELYPAARVHLYDFSGYSSYNCEPIPEREDTKAATQWYWEAGHFKKELGEVVLGRILAKPGRISRDVSDTDFGMRLEQENLFENQQRIAQERAVCLRDHPTLFREADSLVAAARAP